jgi:putative inorganic carbon (hco3(-)) transporter
MSVPMDPAVVFAARPALARKTRVDVLLALLVGYAALLPFEWGVENMLRFSAADVALILALFFAVSRLRYRPENWSVWHYSLLALFAFSTLSVAARAGELQRYVYFNKDAGLVALFLAYAFLNSALTSWTRIRLVLRAFVISVVLQNLVGLGAWVASTRFGIDSMFVWDNGLRLGGLMGDANAYGGLLATALVICEGACTGREPLFKNSFLYFARVTLAAGLLVSFSRTAWISLGLVFLFLLLTRFETAIRGLFLLLCGAAVTVILMGRSFLALFEDLAFRPEVATGNGRTRVDLVSTGLQSFSRHPFFGTGIGSFFAQQGSIEHNSAVWFLTEFGLVGLVIFCGFLGWFFLKARSAYRRAPLPQKPIVFGITLGFIAMAGMSLGIEAFYQRHWWLTFALIAASNSVALRQRRPRIFVPTGFIPSISRRAVHG